LASGVDVVVDEAVVVVVVDDVVVVVLVEEAPGAAVPLGTHVSVSGATSPGDSIATELTHQVTKVLEQMGHWLLGTLSVGVGDVKVEAAVVVVVVPESPFAPIGAITVAIRLIRPVAHNIFFITHLLIVLASAYFVEVAVTIANHESQRSRPRQSHAQILR
jgi:hypothetical protein